METGCSFFNTTTNLWQSHGLIVGNLEVINGVEYIICESTHLTDFSTITSSATPELNTVDPIADASLLFNYDPTNMLVPIILALIFGSFVALSWVCDRQEKKEADSLHEYKRKVFVRTGSIRTEGELVKENKESRNKLKLFLTRLRNEHSWAAFIAPRKWDQVTLSKPQVHNEKIFLC